MKKVLFVTYCWPPAGGPGIQRAVKFCKYLLSFGWEPYVVSVEHGRFPAVDSSLKKDVRSIKVFNTKDYGFIGKKRKEKGDRKTLNITNLKKLKLRELLNKVKSFIRINFLIPDAKIFWYRSAWKKAEVILKKEKINLIFSTSPPFTAQLIGLKLKKKFRLPWVVDFRDPWLEQKCYSTTYRNPMATMINKKMELKVLNNADRIITVGRELKSLLKNKVDKDIAVISNGYDIEDFDYEIKKSNRFILGYYGTLSHYQIPKELFNLLISFRDSRPEIYKDLVIYLGGDIYPEALKIILGSFPAEKLKILGYLNHDALAAQLLKEQVLLQLIHEQKNNEVLIGAKLYEYIHTGNPILCIGNKKSDAAALVNLTKTGKVCNYEEKEVMKDFLVGCYEKWKKNELNSGKRRFEKYERKNLANRLAEIFDEILISEDNQS
jgi:glycosyltransferase involved in cell wall biosynthesis